MSEKAKETALAIVIGFSLGWLLLAGLWHTVSLVADISKTHWCPDSCPTEFVCIPEAQVMFRDGVE